MSASFPYMPLFCSRYTPMVKQRSSNTLLGLGRIRVGPTFLYFIRISHSFGRFDMPDKILLTLLNGTGYVFDVDDYMELRMKHRIVGSFVGIRNSPGGSCLPAELSTLETRLLVEEGIAQLVSKADSLLRTPTSKEIATIESMAEARLAAQADALKAERLRDAERNIENILAGKRKKLLLAGKPTEQLTVESVLQEIGDQFVFEKKNALVEIACAHAEPHEARIVQLPPLSSIDALKYRVLRHYWLDDKYVTAGDSFGGDFLIYPGDPLCYHSTHVINVLKRPTSLQLLDLISQVRLTVAVNKTYVIAYTAGDPTDETIHYQTIEWDGNNEDDESAEQFETSSDSSHTTTEQSEISSDNVSTSFSSSSDSYF